MDIQDYKALSIKYNFGQPASYWDMFYHTVIATLNQSPDTKEVKRAVTLWKKSFQKCIDALPRSKQSVQYYWTFDHGFDFVIVTEHYICGFETLYYENTVIFNFDNGEESIKEDFNIFNLDELFNRADTLIDGEYDIFREMSDVYKTIKDALIFFRDHITFRSTDKGYDCLCDTTVIYSGERGMSGPNDVENWKV